MTTWETVLVLAGIPLAVVLLVSVLTLRPNFARTPRYRPGDPWRHPPVWWTADPRRLPPDRRPAEPSESGPQDRDGDRPGARPGEPYGGCRSEW